MQNFDIGAMAAALNREMDDIPVILLTIEHKSLTENVYLSTDNTQILFMDEETQTPVYGTVSRGRQYLFCPMTVTLPSAHGQEAGQASIRFDNITRMLMPVIRKAQARDGFPVISFEIVLITPGMPESVDFPVASYPKLNITSVSYNQLSVTASIAVNSLAGEPFPGMSFSPVYFPALFGALR